MYVANETLTLVGTPDEILAEIARRIAEGWDVDTLIRHGNEVQARIVRNNMRPPAGG